MSTSIYHIATSTILLVCAPPTVVVSAPPQALPQPKCFRGTLQETLDWCEQDNYCCDLGLDSCQWKENATIMTEICQGSCIGSGACDFSLSNADSIHVSMGSCMGTDACFGLGLMGGSIRIESNSCQGEGACSYGQGSVGAYSCQGLHACGFSSGTVGHDSCLLDLSCHASVLVGDCVSHCPVGGQCPGECATTTSSEKAVEEEQEEEELWVSMVARRIFNAWERTTSIYLN